MCRTNKHSTHYRVHTRRGPWDLWITIRILYRKTYINTNIILRSGLVVTVRNSVRFKRILRYNSVVNARHHRIKLKFYIGIQSRFVNCLQTARAPANDSYSYYIIFVFFPLRKYIIYIITLYYWYFY